MDDSFPLLTYLLPEESIGSWIGRSSMIAGSATTRNLWQMCTGANSWPAVALPGGLDRLSIALGIADREMLPLKHTSLPAYRPFVNSRVYREAMMTMREDPKVPGGASANFPSGPGGTEARFCPECAIADLDQYGTSYTHRHHCMPGVYVCVLHGRLLSSGCGECDSSAQGGRKFRRLGAVCECGSALRPSIGVISNYEIAVLYRFSRNIADFLHVLGPAGVTKGQVASAYREAFKRASIQRAEHLAEFLRERFGQDLFRLVNIKFCDKSPVLRLLASNGSPPSSLIWNSIIVDAFFGGVKSLLGSSIKFEVGVSDKRMEECYKRLKKSVDDGESLSRRDLLEKFPIEYSLVRSVDVVWTFKLFRNIKKYKRKDLEKIDEKLLAHMRSSLCKLEADSKYPTKITRAQLVKGFAGINQVFRMIGALPKSSEFINKNVDSPERFMCKVVIFIMMSDNDHGMTTNQKLRRRHISIDVARSLVTHGLPGRGKEPPEVRRYIAYGVQYRLRHLE